MSGNNENRATTATAVAVRCPATLGAAIGQIGGNPTAVAGPLFMLVVCQHVFALLPPLAIIAYENCPAPVTIYGQVPALRPMEQPLVGSAAMTL